MKCREELRMVNGGRKQSAVSGQRSAGKGPVARAPGSGFCRAFTLAELLVSLVILVGMMTMVAMIFSTAGKSSGIAQAQTKLHRQVLQVFDTIRVDLENTLPGTGQVGSNPQAPLGFLAIAGVTVNAQDTLKDPSLRLRRADVLMVLSQQQFEPFIYQPPTGITTFDPYKLVVYGHADVGKLNSAGQWIGAVKHVENPSGWLASEWHLGRRVIGFVSEAAGPAGTVLWQPSAPAAPVSPAILGTHLSLLTDAVYTPITPILSQTMPGLYVYARGGSGAMGLGYCYFEHAAGNQYYWDGTTLYRLAAYPSGTTPAYWWQYKPAGSNPPLLTEWTRSEKGALISVFAPPLPAPAQWPALPAGYSLPDQPGLDLYRFWPDWFYAPYRASGANDSYRTRIDPMPPAGMPGRTASHFLPSCAEFKVEFTYDDPREIAVNPTTGQPIGADINGDGTFDVPATSPVKWESVPNGQIMVWTGLGTEANVYPPVNGVEDQRNRTFPYRWPRALRITIRAYAPGGALDYPVEQTLVHVWE